MSNLPIPAAHRAAHARTANASRALARRSRRMAAKPVGAVFYCNAREKIKNLPSSRGDGLDRSEGSSLEAKAGVGIAAKPGPEVGLCRFFPRCLTGAGPAGGARYDSIRMKYAIESTPCLRDPLPCAQPICRSMLEPTIPRRTTPHAEP